MCTNFIPTLRDRFQAGLGWLEPTFDYPKETWPGYLAPIRILAPDTQEPEYRAARFGLIPFWAKDEKIGRNTMNARSETVFEKPSFREPWKKRRYALIPMRAFFEPDYETGKAIRWRIERQDEQPFTVAAIWDRWKQGEDLITSFSMLTLNATNHPVMGRFHAPGDEKRSLVIVPPEHRDDWLHATQEEARGLLKPMPAEEFTARPDPRPPRNL